MYRASDGASGVVVADRLRSADTHWTRLRGLLGTSGLAPGEGLWIRPCRQVHMFGMRYPIDVVFLDERLGVVHTIPGLAPWAVSPRIGTAERDRAARGASRASASRGARLEIITGRQWTAPRPPGWVPDGRARANLLLAVFYALFAGAHWDRLRQTGGGDDPPDLPQETLLVVLFLIRRPSRAIVAPADWLLASRAFQPRFHARTRRSARACTGRPVQIAGPRPALVRSRASGAASASWPPIAGSARRGRTAWSGIRSTPRTRSPTWAT
jgi:uncharacterized membrane protein (UPF0127 family)